MAALALVLVSLPVGSHPAAATSPNLVISQVYGGGGNTGAPFNSDFVEIFNRGSAAVSLAGLSIQYASATGTGSFGATSTQQSDLPAVTIGPGQYYLIQEASGATGATLAPDLIDTTPIAMSATGGKVALVTGTTSLGCNGGSTPCSAAAISRIIDLVGYDGANYFEGASAAPALSNTTAALRGAAGCIDTDSNGADFSAAAPGPRNTSSPLHFCDADTPPQIAARTPANGATDVGLDANVSVTFSEDVSLRASWYGIVCASSGTHTAVVSGGPITYTLDPDKDFSSAEVCTVTVYANAVSDSDANDPPDNMAADVTWSFTTTDAFLCTDPATAIHEIQGTGTSSPVVGSVRTIQAVVVGDYQQAGGFRGFYVQEEDADADADPATSEGIFVFDSTAVGPGDLVRVRGTVTEFVSSGSQLTELAAVTRVQICATGASVTPTEVTLPVADLADFERYEGMLVHFTQTLTATETFGLGRFGEVRLAADGRLYTPTAITTPGAAAIAQEDLNRRRSFILDDGSNVQNADPTLYPAGGLSASNTLRSGYTVSGISGVFDQRFGSYRMQPVGPVSFTAANPRTAAPAAVGGRLRVASFNVLNFFNGDGLGGGFPTARGATTPFELSRQKAKEISALQALNGDIVGLMELENDAPPNSAIEDLVAGLNAAMGAGTYAFIDTGVIGTDAIKVALIYKPAAVMPVGAYRIIDSSVDPRFVDTKNRPSLAQTFQSKTNGAKLTVVVNHLKSKGSACDDLLDPDTGDGQGNCNRTRTNAAAALVDWLATDPTGSGDPDVLLIGDLNSYTFEDPISTLTGGGYTNLVRRFGGLGAYSYVFNGEAGYLDHALATSALASQVTGTTDWHINADEPVVLDYNTEFKTANQVTTFYDAGPYRSSDHDPVVVGIDLATTYVSVCDLTRTLVADRGIANSLCQKLDAAAAAAARGQIETAHNVRDAYVNEVNAQRGRQIADADAAVLVAAAGAL